MAKPEQRPGGVVADPLGVDQGDPGLRVDFAEAPCGRQAGESTADDGVVDAGRADGTVRSGLRGQGLQPTVSVV